MTQSDYQSEQTFASIGKSGMNEFNRNSIEDDEIDTVDPRILTQEQVARLMKEAAQNSSSDGKREKMIQAYTKWIKPRRDNQY